MEENSLEELNQEEKELLELLRKKAFDMQMKKVGLYIGSDEEQKRKQLEYRTLQQEIRDLKHKLVNLKIRKKEKEDEENIRR